MKKIFLKFFLLMPIIAVGGGVEPPTMQLAKEQNLVVNPSRHWKKPVRLYSLFILNSPPPRQEGTAASFVILQYLSELYRFSKEQCKVKSIFLIDKHYL
ncbi:MAG: hypothetical protein U0V04_08295 [Spirosomataceae bacterium]|jgi:hypothetical protein